MTYRENIKAILECNFAGYKEEIIENTCSRILALKCYAEKTGRWIPSPYPEEKYICSNCGGACWYYDVMKTVKQSKYCPNCGAHMWR